MEKHLPDSCLQTAEESSKSRQKNQSLQPMVHLFLQLMKGTVLVERSGFFFFFLDPLCSAALYRHESGRC
jgi:hypothetical protein